MTTRQIAIPDELDDGLTAYLAAHPDWTCDRVMTAALAKFLCTEATMDNLATAKRAARIYMDTLLLEGDRP